MTSRSMYICPDPVVSCVSLYFKNHFVLMCGMDEIYILLALCFIYIKIHEKFLVYFFVYLDVEYKTHTHTNTNTHTTLKPQRDAYANDIKKVWTWIQEIENPNYNTFMCTRWRCNTQYLYVKHNNKNTWTQENRIKFSVFCCSVC